MLAEQVRSGKLKLDIQCRLYNTSLYFAKIRDRRRLLFGFPRTGYIFRDCVLIGQCTEFSLAWADTHALEGMRLILWRCPNAEEVFRVVTRWRIRHLHLVACVFRNACRVPTGLTQCSFVRCNVGGVIRGILRANWRTNRVCLLDRCVWASPGSDHAWEACVRELQIRRLHLRNMWWGAPLEILVTRSNTIRKIMLSRIAGLTVDIIHRLCVYSRSLEHIALYDCSLSKEASEAIRALGSLTTAEIRIENKDPRGRHTDSRAERHYLHPWRYSIALRAESQNHFDMSAGAPM